MQQRYTMQHVTLNTNRAGTTAAEVEHIQRDLRRFFLRDLSRIETWRPLLRVEPDFSVVDDVQVNAIGLEVGSKRHFVHVHFTVTIRHRGKVTVIGKGSQAEWQKLLNQRLPYLKGGYANITLMNARALNYATKTAGTGNELAVSDGPLEPIVF